MMISLVTIGERKALISSLDSEIISKCLSIIFMCQFVVTL